MTASILLALTACGDKDSTGDSGPVETDIFSEFIYVTETPVSEDGVDLGTCHTPGGDWLAQSPDSSCATEHTFSGKIEDFQEGTGVADADLELFFSDRYDEGNADFTTVSDASGAVSGTIMACTPTTYRVYTDPALDETKITIQSHEVYDNNAGGELDIDFNSVSSTTYNIIPGLLGITVQPGQGIVAGTAYGCGGDGDPVQFAQVIVKDEDGNYLEDYTVKYFVEEFPSRDQEWTSEDGLWVAINVPPGRITVEMWTYDGAEYQLQGETSLDIVPDSINVANIFTGSGGENGGVVYPESCLSACEG